MHSFSIIDGYIDEPTCLGVPPYISPYPRYISGAIIDVIPQANISYYTIDQIRNTPELLKKIYKTDMVIFIAGISVPGKYLAGYPASYQEIKKIAAQLPTSTKILCGPAAKYGMASFGGKKPKSLDDTNLFNMIISGDPEIIIYQFLKSNQDPNTIRLDEKRKNASQISSFAEKGSMILKQHPYFPQRIITEIETYRGCSRSSTDGCSFCSEPFKGPPDFRKPEEIISEIKSLYQTGIRHIRLGNQPCLFSYMANDAKHKEYPRPNPDILKTLFSGIAEVGPDLKTFHIDNVNPGIIARYPEEAKEIAKIIISYHTPGDVAAFGVESVDPKVIDENNLKADKNQVLKAIELFNKLGKKRGSNGLPELLPGLNFVFGLLGETKKTYQLNYDFLKTILEQNLLIRRINIRQVIPIPGTKMGEIGPKIILRNINFFKSFKYRVKHHIEHPLLQKLVPSWTKLTNVYMELWKGKHTFGRQLGSYPILIGTHGNLSLHQSFDMIITDHGFRSLTGFPTPFFINIYSRDCIQGLPGIGKKRAIRILKNRPFNTIDEFIKIFDDSKPIQNIIPHLSFSTDEKIHEHLNKLPKEYDRRLQ